MACTRMIGNVEALTYMMDHDTVIAVDTETSMTDKPWERYILGTSIYSPSLEEGWYFPAPELGFWIKELLDC